MHSGPSLGDDVEPFKPNMKVANEQGQIGSKDESFAKVERTSVSVKKVYAPVKDPLAGLPEGSVDHNELQNRRCWEEGDDMLQHLNWHVLETDRPVFG